MVEARTGPILGGRTRQTIRTRLFPHRLDARDQCEALHCSGGTEVPKVGLANDLISREALPYFYRKEAGEPA